MDHLDAELWIFQPLPAHGALLRTVRARGAFRVRRPEHDHVTILQAIFDRAVGFRLTDAQRVPPMMNGTPVPTFPGIGIVMNACHPNCVCEAVEGGKIVTDVTPGVMRAVRGRD